MDPMGFNSGAKAAIGSIRESMAVGKEGAKLITDIQADMRSTVVEQQRNREKERQKQANLGNEQEQRAYRKLLNKQAQEKASNDLKEHILKTHGSKAWQDFLKIKTEVEIQEKADAKLMRKDEQKVSEVFWWCFAASSILTYFLVAM